MIRRAVNYLPFIAEDLVVAIHTKDRMATKRLFMEIVKIVLPIIKNMSK